MIPFQPITDSEPAFAHSVLLRAALLLLDYIEVNGPIGLTPSKALKRYFVEWAAEAFEWPNFTASELYEMNKVLNEPDFPPLMVLHDLLISAKLTRHYKGAMHTTKQGRQLKSKPAVLWMVLVNHLLCVLDHSAYTRYGDQLVGDWKAVLRCINREAQMPVTDQRLCAAMFGGSEKDALRDTRLRSILYLHVLRPLCWAGLLEEQVQGSGFDRVRVFVKTPLWTAALDLPPDEHETRPTIQ